MLRASIQTPECSAWEPGKLLTAPTARVICHYTHQLHLLLLGCCMQPVCESWHSMWSLIMPVMTNKQSRFSSFHFITEAARLSRSLEINTVCFYRCTDLFRVCVCVCLITFLLSSIALSRSFSRCSHSKRRQAWRTQTWMIRNVDVVTFHVLIGGCRFSYPRLLCAFPVFLRSSPVLWGTSGRPSWRSQKCVVLLFTQKPHWLEPGGQLASEPTKYLKV